MKYQTNILSNGNERNIMKEIIKMVLYFLILNLCVSLVVFAQGHTFSTYNTGTITGGGSAKTQVLDVTGLSSDYLFFVLSF